MEESSRVESIAGEMGAGSAVLEESAPPSSGFIGARTRRVTDAQHTGRAGGAIEPMEGGDAGRRAQRAATRRTCPTRADRSPPRAHLPTSVLPDIVMLPTRAPEGARGAASGTALLCRAAATPDANRPPRVLLAMGQGFPPSQRTSAKTARSSAHVGFSSQPSGPL